MNDQNPFLPSQLAADPWITDETNAGHPLATIWLSPRGTIRRIINRDPTYWVMPLACGNGITSMLAGCLTDEEMQEWTLPGIFAFSLIGGAIFGLLGIWIYAFLMRWVGTWIGGVATNQTMRAALAWGYVPSMVGGVVIASLMLVVRGLAGNAVLSDNMVDGVVLLTAIAQIAAALWSLIVVCNTVAEVQGFRSALAGLGNFILVSIVFAGVALVVVVIVSLLMNA